MSNGVFLRPDENGSWGKIAVASTTGVEATVSSTFVDSVANATPAMSTGAFAYGYNNTAWERIRTSGAGDGLTPTGIPVAGLHQFDSVSGTWIRTRAASAGDALGGTNIPTSGLFGYNGTTWDRLRTVGAGDGIGTGLLANGNYVWDAIGLVWNRMRSANSVADATTGTTTPSSIPYGFNGTNFDRIRVGKVYKYIEYLNLPTSTSTTVWTPSSGKKFRLMGVSISTSASVHLHLRDSGTIFHTVRPLATTVTFSFGNGYLSALVGNVLEIRNDSGTTTNVWVTAWGTEE